MIYVNVKLLIPKMGRFIDITGQKFGRLMVIERIGTSKSGGNALWLCQCFCGQLVTIQAPDLKSGHTQSCGCLQKEVIARRSTIHGHNLNRKVSSTYGSWRSMKTRCFNPNDPAYNSYGGRGITVCERWKKSFKNFLEDMGESSIDLQIDRIDNNGNYNKSNCRWTTSKTNNRNRRNNRLITYKGETRCLSEWAEKYNINPNTLWMRLNQYNWSLEKALTTSVGSIKEKFDE